MCLEVLKNVRTRIANLKKRGAFDWQAYEWGKTRLVYWCVSYGHILSSAISNEKLKRAGYPNILDSYFELLVSAKSRKSIKYVSSVPINRHCGHIIKKVSPLHTSYPSFLADSRS